MTRFYDYRGFTGVEADIRISLVEYGIAWKKIKAREYKFIYAIAWDDSGESTRYDCAFMREKDILSLLKESWIDKKAVSSFLGYDIDTTSTEALPVLVSDLVRYHGYENIFGASYTEGFQIK